MKIGGERKREGNPVPYIMIYILLLFGAAAHCLPILISCGLPPHICFLFWAGMVVLLRYAAYIVLIIGLALVAAVSILAAAVVELYEQSEGGAGKEDGS